MLLTLQYRLLVPLAFLALWACSPTSVFEREAPAKLTVAEPIDSTVVQFDTATAFDKLNQVRRKHFLSTFRPDPRLMEAARRHADLMGATGRFGHEFGPDTKFKRRIFAVGFDNSAGENIGVGYRNIDAAIEGWLNSPGHRKILLKRHFSVGGIAYAKNTSGKNPRLNHFWVLIVGKE
ncbi:MAG: CAP domain-containing protein [Pseudomonadota bacterium]